MFLCLKIFKLVMGPIPCNIPIFVLVANKLAIKVLENIVLGMYCKALNEKQTWDCMSI